MTRPRVIFVNRVYWPAAAATAQLLTDLAEALAARGWPVTVVASGSQPETLHRGVRILRTGGDTRHVNRFAQLGNYLRFHQRVRRILREEVRPGDLVVIKTDPPLLGVSADNVVRARGGQVIHWVQDIYPEIVPAHFGAWTRPFVWPLLCLRNQAWRHAALSLPVGDDMQLTLRQAGVSADRCPVMPNWAPLELATPPNREAVSALREKWGVANRFVVAYSGNLGRVHTFDAILNAADALREQPGIVFLFIGEGPRFQEVKRQVGLRRLDNIRFLPPQPREILATSLAAADAHFVTLLPGFERLVNPSKLAGILAAGRPALFVGPPSCQMARDLAATGSGWSFAPEDGTGLANQIKALADNPATRQSADERARSHFAARYTFDAAITRWEQLLDAAAAFADKPGLPSRDSKP